MTIPVSQWEAKYQDTLDLWMAVNMVDILAYEAANTSICHCSKCRYYRSPEWKAIKPADLTPEALTVNDRSNQPK
ncbi:unnamed protein product [Phytophthora fragariaefolia]|uniref:Unnamed protein product n=1 Tax=Phytophthora fragariaefolia TaxID=1490495 RepID=A0A9W6XLV9_9STRA|nr:unnamed protein product [Phytophthora fragariaefolia]